MAKACLIHQILKFVEDEKQVLGSKLRPKEAWKEHRQVSGSRRSAWQAGATAPQGLLQEAAHPPGAAVCSGSSANSRPPFLTLLPQTQR